MSADAPKRNGRLHGQSVRPQPYSDKSVMDTVVDFFQDVAYAQSPPKPDDMERIQWVNFQEADINDLCHNPNLAFADSVSPLLLVIGYSSGAQIWAIQSTGEAMELLSIRNGPMRALRILPSPQLGSEGVVDNLANKRPLVAVCDTSSVGEPYYGVKVVSLRSADEVTHMTFAKEVVGVHCNSRVLVIALVESLVVYDNCSLVKKFTITSCYLSPGPCANPIALGHRWLAYADKKLVPCLQSRGGFSGDNSASYTASVISAAKSVKKGLSMFSQTIASNWTGGGSRNSSPKESSVPDTSHTPGLVTIVDITEVRSTQFNTCDSFTGEGLVAHFPAHTTHPLVALAFNPSGDVLITADKPGHAFHVFRVLSHPVSCTLGAVHHLYTLYRGDTTCKVQDMAFTMDTRWVAVSTMRGTTHVFPITPYGGSVNARTHLKPLVQNRASLFHRSAGLEDVLPHQSGRDSPQLPSSGSSSGSPSASSHLSDYNVLAQNALNSHISNPRLPPFPSPLTQTAVIQIRQSHLSLVPGLGGSGGSSAAASGRKGRPQGLDNGADSGCVAATFAASRGWVAGAPISGGKDIARPVSSLFIMSHTGVLVEHVLDVSLKALGGSDKASDDCSFEVTTAPRAQWPLRRNVNWPEIRLPLANANELILASECIQSGYSNTDNLRRNASRESVSSDHSYSLDPEEEWLSEVEIQTYMGPHRRLWMGPQFTFKTFQHCGNSSVALSPGSSVLLSQSPPSESSSPPDVFADEVELQSLSLSASRSSPVAMPPGSMSGQYRASRHSSGGSYSSMRVIEAGSFEQSPQMFYSEGEPESMIGLSMDSQLQRHLADAMMDIPATPPGCRPRTTSIDLDTAGFDQLSESSGSAGSGHYPPPREFDARSSPVHSIDTVLVFPTNDSSEASQ